MKHCGKLNFHCGSLLICTLFLLIVMQFYGCGNGKSGNVPGATSSTSFQYTGRWINTGGPTGGIGYDLRFNPENPNVMMVTDVFGGVGISHDRGATWRRSNSGIDIYGDTNIDEIPIFSLTIDPNNPGIVWSGSLQSGAVSGFGVFRSTDGGQTWTKKINGFSGMGISFRGFTIMPVNSNIVFAMGELGTETDCTVPCVKGFIYKTIDGGENWTKIWEAGNLTRYLHIDPRNHDVMYLSTGLFDRYSADWPCDVKGVGGGFGVYKSTDGGQTWNQINNGLNDMYVGSLRMHPTNPDILFAATGHPACSGVDTPNPGLYITTNGGASWTQVISGTFLSAVNFSPSNPNVVYAAGNQSVHRSSDGGNTWTRYRDSDETWGPSDNPGGWPIDLVVDPDDVNTLYINSYGGGVYRSTNGGQTWETWTKGFTGSVISDIHVADYDSGDLYMCGKTGSFRTNDYGNTYRGFRGRGSVGNASFETNPTDSNTVLNGGFNGTQINLSVDGGLSFREVYRVTSTIGVKAFAFAPSNTDIVYAGGCYNSDVNPEEYAATNNLSGVSFLKSTDGGATWLPVSSSLDNTCVNKIVVDPSNPNVVFAATHKGIYKSVNGGVSWSRFDNLGQRVMMAMVIDFTDSYIIAGEGFGGIWISENGGTSWTGPHNTGINSGNPWVNAIIVEPENKNNVYMSDFYSGVYRSLDRGKTWAPFPDSSMSGLTVKAVKDLDISKYAIFAGTQAGGLYRFDRAAHN